MYFDTSVIVTMIAGDSGWEAVEAWLTEKDPANAYSDFGLGEVHAALGNRVRRGEATDIYIRDLLASSRDFLAAWEIVRITSSDIADATDMLGDFTLALRLPDAIHLATARRLGVPIVSTDRQQVRAARKLGLAAINPLERNETRS